jgi:hypothetical protein
MEVGQPDSRAEIEAVYRRRYGKFLRVAVAILCDEIVQNAGRRTRFNAAWSFAKGLIQFPLGRLLRVDALCGLAGSA